MATRKEARRRAVLQVSALIVVAAVVMAAVVAGASWLSNRPAPHPSEISITVSNGEESLEIFPYQVCELGTVCGDPAEIPVFDASPGDVLRFEVDEQIYDHDWQAVTIYDEPGANDQLLHGPYDTDHFEVPVTADPVGDSDTEPQLVVVEISSVMLGVNEQDEETAFATVWTVATQEPA